MNTKSLPTVIMDADKKTLSLSISPFQSILLLFFSYAPAYIIYTAIHELGHAIVGLIKGYTIVKFVAHPFLVSYVILDPSTVSLEGAAAGTAMALLVSSLIGIMFWKRRSTSNLPLQMLLPIALIMEGFNILLGLTSPSDYYWIMQFTGLPAILFYVTGFVLISLGIFFFSSLFPLLGSAPEDRKSLFVVPAGIFLYSVLVVIFTYLFEPVSNARALHHLDPTGFAITRANMFLIMGLILGVILAVIYTTLYRRFYRRLPAGLQTEKVNLTWRDLQIPGLLSTILVVVLLIIYN